MLTRAKTLVASVATAAIVAASTLAIAPTAQAHDTFYQGQMYQNNDWRWHRHHRYNQYNQYNQYGYNGYDNGGAVALGIISLFAGAVLGNVAHPHRLHRVSYCAQRFRSWDAGSRTYLGFDGLRHHCG